MDDLADQVQSLFYHDIHFNNVNMRMHTELGCETSQNRSKQVFKVDMGADGNLMPITMFMKLYPKISLETLAKTIDKGITLFVYNNTPIKQYATCSVKITFNGKQEICKFYVVEHTTAILGVSDSEKLGLVKVNFDVIQSKTVKMVHNISLSEVFKHEIESEYPELFEGIGCMDGEISIKLKEGAIPDVEPIRCVLHAMQEPFKMELDKLCKEGILHKIDISEPVEWLNSFVCVKKPNGKIRLCLDPTHLNKSIIRPHHSATLVDDILHRLNGAKYFTVVDSTSLIFNHKLDKESSKLMTFGTPFGRYRYLRMPMGASLSSDVYQYKVDDHLEHIENCVAIADDIIIFGFNPDGTDHDVTVRQVMNKAKEVSMRFNPTKYKFKRTEVKFLGMVLNRQGVVPDPAKIEALLKLPEPKTEALLQGFLGMINYLSRFEPKIADLTNWLRSLLKKSNEFIWTDVHSDDFKKLINIMCNSSKLLRYYRPDLDLYLETDASGVTIGMALLQSAQNGRSSLYTVAYDSKTLTSAETRFTNIECELLGIVGGLEKFNYFPFGRPVMILTDHKPLIAISKKSLVSAPPRLQHLLLRLGNYNVELQWIPGKEMIFSDHLSHNVIAGDSSNKPTSEGLDLKIHNMYLNASDDKCLSLATEMTKDPVMQALKHQIIKGWPSIRSECSSKLQDYWNYRDELSVLGGLVLKGSCIIIPQSCRDEILNQLHEGHFGSDRTKLHARDSVYWPNMNKHIKCLVKSCDLCQEHSRRNNKDPAISREIPIQAWSTVQTDLFTLDNQTFLLVVDVTSWFPVVRILRNEITTSVINALKGIYCDFGLPKRIIRDNRPCFKATEFSKFHTKLGVVTDTISSYNHTSLGSAEQMVQTVKQIMVKNPQNACLGMLIFKATMIPEIQKSPRLVNY